MKKYQYNGKEYDNLWLLRRDFRQFVFPRNPDDAALEAIGIIVIDIPDPQPDPEEAARAELAMKISQIDMETSSAITGGFDYEVNGETLRFSYDSFDQQNFADTANACLMVKSGLPGLPQSVTWNAYRADGTLVRLELTADNGTLHFSIFNQGRTIPENDLPKIWTKFYRDSNAGYSGSGLGLSIVAQILSMQNLPYGAENRVDGVLFWFSIPVTE